MEVNNSQNKMKITFINQGSNLPKESIEELQALLLVVLNLEVESDCKATLHNETLCLVIKKGEKQLCSFCQQVGNAESGKLQPLRLEEVSAGILKRLSKRLTSKTIGVEETAVAANA